MIAKNIPASVALASTPTCQHHHYTGPHLVGDALCDADEATLPAEILPAVDLPRAERAVRELLLAVGEDPQREGLLDTPRRVAKAYAELFRGMYQHAATHLGKVFHEGTDELVIVRRIDFHSVCEHHLLPVAGQAHIAYLPQGGRVVGLSKLARTVEVFAHRAQVQERMTAQIADALMDHLQPRGVIVLVEADHYCMKMRGVRNQCSNTVTLSTRGIYRQDDAARREVLSLLRTA